MVIFAPIIKNWARRMKLPPAKFLIPLSYATILGGICTLIGTSTNLVVDGMIQDAGFKGFSIIRIWDGGMSAHGGVLGVIVALYYFARSRQKAFLAVADFAVPMVPLGLFFGRLGNFINGELWGRVCSYEFPLAMIFPQAADLQPRHPSQLYEAGLEGLVLFIVLWWYSSSPRPQGRVAALFCAGYGAARFFVEYFREPDSFIGLLALGLSQGQWLSLPMVVLGVGLWFCSKKTN